MADAAAKAEKRSAMNVIRRVAPYIWPKGEAWVKRRVVWSLIALVASKLIAVTSPLFYKAAVDAMAGDTGSAAWLLAMGAVWLTIAYGMTRLLNTGFQQLRDVIFARVGQRALRQIALETFNHIHHCCNSKTSNLKVAAKKERRNRKS